MATAAAATTLGKRPRWFYPVLRIAIGAEAPDFDLPSNELGAHGRPGKKVRLADYRGKKNVVLAFFHSKGGVAEQFGLFNAERGVTKRATVIIDKAGKVAWAAEHSEQRDDKLILAELAKLG